jgi:hypothetical protein
MENKKLKVQLITPEGKWPFVGNAFRNRDGSISVYLDEGVALTGGQKLYLRAAREKAATAEPEAERATVE